MHASKCAAKPNTPHKHRDGGNDCITLDGFSMIDFLRPSAPKGHKTATRREQQSRRNGETAFSAAGSRLPQAWMQMFFILGIFTYRSRCVASNQSGEIMLRVGTGRDGIGGRPVEWGGDGAGSRKSYRLQCHSVGVLRPSALCVWRTIVIFRLWTMGDCVGKFVFF